MPEDPTTQTTAPEATPSPDPASTDIQTQTGATEPNAGTEEPIDWQARHSEASRKITEQGQELANIRAQRDMEAQQIAQYQNALAALGTQQQTAADPKAAALSQFQEHLYAGDTAAANRAFSEWDQMRSNEIARQAAEQAMRQHQIMESMRKASDLSGVQDQSVLASQLNPITGNLMADDLVVVKAYREGRLGELAGKLSAKADEERQKAELLRALPGMGGGKGAPGQSAPKKIAIPFEEWAIANEQAKQRLRDSDEEFVVTGAPKYFDPSKD